MRRGYYFYVKGFEQGGRNRRFREKTVRRTVFADGATSECEAKGTVVPPKIPFSVPIIATALLRRGYYFYVKGFESESVVNEFGVLRHEIEMF